jgi:hypothetical protein
MQLTVKPTSVSNIPELVNHFTPAASAVQPQPGSAPVDQVPPQSEMDIMAGFTELLVADLIRRTFQYLEQNSGKSQQLLALAPLLEYAVQARNARNLELALQVLYQAYRTIRLMRVSVPALPPIL